jgi:Protein of unknown function (DUF3619)
VNQINQTLTMMPPLHAEALEGQVGLRLAGHLSRGAEALPHDISERLRFGRERAMAVALAQRRAPAAQGSPAAAVLVSPAGRAATLGGSPSVWLRLASLLPLLVLAAGLVMIQHHHDLEQIAVAVEIDSALLADDLPPAAYGDPGFVEYLRSAESP